MMALRIVLAEHNDTVRDLLKTLLETRSRWHVVADVRDGRSAIEKTRELNPDIVILDFGMPGMTGIDATREIVKELPGMRVLLLTVHDSEWFARLALSAGARCCLLKSEVPRRLVPAVESIIAR
jgi:DNA-binding NarL/FixJ family response regulator